MKQVTMTHIVLTLVDICLPEWIVIPNQSTVETLLEHYALSRVVKYTLQINRGVEIIFLITLHASENHHFPSRTLPSSLYSERDFMMRGKRYSSDHDQISELSLSTKAAPVQNVFVSPSSS